MTEKSKTAKRKADKLAGVRHMKERGTMVGWYALQFLRGGKWQTFAHVEDDPDQWTRPIAAAIKEAEQREFAAGELFGIGQASKLAFEQARAEALEEAAKLCDHVESSGVKVVALTAGALAAAVRALADKPKETDDA